MQLKSTCERIYNIPTKNVTQDIPWETLIKRKTQSPKASITMYIIQQKISLQYNHESLQSHSHNQAIHVNKDESIHHMPCFQPSQMLPWLTCQSLVHSTLAFFPFLFSHPTTTLVVAYIVASLT